MLAEGLPLFPYLWQARYKSYKGFKAYKSIWKNKEVVKQVTPRCSHAFVFFHFSCLSFLDNILDLIDEPVRPRTTCMYIHRLRVERHRVDNIVNMDYERRRDAMQGFRRIMNQP